MNYLAHLYLSGENEKILVGNFIGDYVKGNKFLQYPAAIRQGIIIHRHIDSFTDNHSKFREAKQLLRDDFGLYSGIIVDLFYDHFLARNWNHYSKCSLPEFTEKTHKILQAHHDYLPKRVKGFLPSLIQNRRLESYAQKEGIQKSLEIMSRYTSLPDKSEAAIQILKKNYLFFEKNFGAFIDEMIMYLNEEFEIEIKRPG